MKEIRKDDVKKVADLTNVFAKYGLTQRSLLAMGIEDMYNRGTEECLNTALLMMHVYLNQGFLYEEHRDLFDVLLQKLGTTREQQFSCLKGMNVVPLTRAQVDHLIVKWSGSIYHTMTRSQVVDDIMEKVKKKMIGKYEYHSNANPKGNSLDYVYILEVTNNDNILYNINLNRIYRLEAVYENRNR